jgi:hypothetical protein
MKIYVCWSTRRFGHEHPCAVAYDAVIDAGYEPEVVYAKGLGILPEFMNPFEGRREVRERSGGNQMVPALITDDDEFIQGSQEIVAWAEAHPAA